jgi:hypothetical protein
MDDMKNVVVIDEFKLNNPAKWDEFRDKVLFALLREQSTGRIKRGELLDFCEAQSDKRANGAIKQVKSYVMVPGKVA